MSAIIWFFGISGITANFLIYQQKNRKHLLTVKLISDCLWSIHYGALGAWSGAATCMIGIVRESVFLQQHRKWANSKLWLLLFVFCSILSAIFTWRGFFSILPACASVLSVVSFWIGNPWVTRCLQVPISIAVLTYNIVYRSYAGIANEAFTLCSIIIAICQTSVKSNS